MHPRRPKALRVALAIVATVAVCGAYAARPDDRTPLLKTLDSLFCAGRYDTLHTLIPGLIRAAEARGDSAELGRLAFQYGRVEITLGHQAVASREFDRAIRLTEAFHDTVGLLPALNFKAFVLRDQGNNDAAMALFEREVDLGRRARVVSGEANGMYNLAYRDLRRGDLESALAGHRRALELYRRTGNLYSIAGGFNGMGLVYRSLGEADSCRLMHGETLRIARAEGYPFHELWALNNLGFLEGDMGNYELSLNYYRAALAIGRRIKFDRGTALPAMNVAVASSYLGERDKAEEALDECLMVAKRAGFKDMEVMTTIALGIVNLQAGRNHRASALFRKILHREDVYETLRRSQAAYNLALSLADLDSVSAAIAVLEPFVAPHVQVPDYIDQAYFEIAYAELLRRNRRFQEALDRAASVRDGLDRAGRTNLGVSVRLIESSCRRELGDPARATQALTGALDSLEVARTEAGQADFREAFGQGIIQDVIEASRVMLEYPPDAPRAERVRMFHDTLQRFKTRTLLERIQDPRGDRGTPIAGALTRTVEMARLQKEVLRPGELLLDLFVGDDESYMFAVSSDSCRLVSLPGARSRLVEQIALYSDLVSASDRKTRELYPPERLTAMQRTLGQVVLGSVADLVESAQHIIVAPDGFYASIPFETLILGDDAVTLLETRDIVEVPSSSVLAWARTAGGIEAGATASMIAVADEDSELRGALDEVDGLERRYAHVERVTAAPGVLETLADRAQGGRILHIAVHARVNDESPWQSGFTLASANGDSTATTLRAWEIARASLPYDAAVLAGCETAAGRATSGEGVLGLTSAFLSAGVPVVVSSRWPVDDRATATLMGHFYEHLARGETVAASLRAAQLAVRGEKRTQHPFYWAGFAVVGDGSRVVPPLISDRGGDAWRMVAAGLAVVGGVGWALRRRRTSPAPAV